jgi:hypothetical protein
MQLFDTSTYTVAPKPIEHWDDDPKIVEVKKRKKSPATETKSEPVDQQKEFWRALPSLEPIRTEFAHTLADHLKKRCDTLPIDDQINVAELRITNQQWLMMNYNLNLGKLATNYKGKGSVRDTARWKGLVKAIAEIEKIIAKELALVEQLRSLAKLADPVEATAKEIPLELPKLSKQVGNLYKSTTVKPDKLGAMQEYPLVEGMRSPDIDEHWYWYFSYEICTHRGKWKSQTKYVKRSMLVVVRELIANKRPYTEVLEVLQ